MTHHVRRIGLSLGADLCWPQFFTDIVAELGPIAVDGRSIDIEVDRVTIEPFDLAQPVRYDVILDRLTPWYATSREWIKKAVVMNGAYTLNSPFTLEAMHKHTSYAAMMRLGVPIPDTWMVPPKEYARTDPLHVDLDVTLERYAQMFDLRALGEKIGYPLFMKPYDGGAWVGVTRISDGDALETAYDSSGSRLMHLQKAVDPFDLFVRCLGVGPQVNVIKYDPDAPIHDRYEVAFDFVDGEEHQHLCDLTLVINTFFGWDFNSCEALRSNGVFHPIDFANANPDSQVTSLHFHIPWLVTSLIRWSLFCAVTRRRMRFDLGWGEFHEIADGIDGYGERISVLAALAREKLDAAAFEEFCESSLADLDEIAVEYFGTDHAKEIVRAKVKAMFPEHEVDRFTDHFWGLIDFWRQTERDGVST